MGPNRLAEFREYLRFISLPLFLYVLLNSVYPISQCQLFVSVGLTDPLPVYPRDIWLLNKLFVENESSSRLTYLQVYSRNRLCCLLSDSDNSFHQW